MTEPLAGDVLAEIRASYPINPDRQMWDTDDAIAAFGHVEILLAEVDRLRARVAADEKFIYDRAFEAGTYAREQAAMGRRDDA